MENEKLNIYAEKDLTIDLGPLMAEGWKKISMGTYPSSGTLKEYDDIFILFLRKRDFNDFFEKSLKSIFLINSANLSSYSFMVSLEG